MEIKPIRTETDYEDALAEIDQLWLAEVGSRDGDKLEILITLVEAYEEKHHPISPPDPVEAIIHMMESQSLSRSDLEPYIGSRARVSEVLNRKRPLSLNMIRKLQSGLGIPADVLIQPYEVEMSEISS
ncbi:MAG: transcriptional regulator [Chloroflexi bacterium]|nr:transcriptional regulator [Ardenticatenaceae bacterium]MBL1130736.1 transcriptional regulator [Chloroflexota bacterium]NOG36831.1 transcriptional regulator [Chloroflexota bacterium]